MSARLGSIATAVLAALLLCANAVRADNGYVRIDVPRGYQGSLAPYQAGFLADPLAGNGDFGVTVFDGLRTRSLVDDNQYRTEVSVSNDLVSWVGPPDLFSYDGRHIDNLTSRDDNFYSDIALDGDRLGWTRPNPDTGYADVVIRENGRERTISHGIFASNLQLSGDNGIFGQFFSDLYYFSAPAGSSHVKLLKNDPFTENTARISGSKVIWVSRTESDPNGLFPTWLKTYDGETNKQRTIYASDAISGLYGVPREIDGFAYPNALFLSGTAPGETHEFLINVETGKVIKIEEVINQATNATFQFAGISGDYVSFVAQRSTFENVVGTYQISTRRVTQIALLPREIHPGGAVWPSNASLAISTNTFDSATQSTTYTGQIYYRLDDYIALILHSLQSRTESILAVNRISSKLNALASATGPMRATHLREFIAEAQAASALSTECRAGLLEAGKRMQEALR